MYKSSLASKSRSNCHFSFMVLKFYLLRKMPMHGQWPLRQSHQRVPQTTFPLQLTRLSQLPNELMLCHRHLLNRKNEYVLYYELYMLNVQKFFSKESKVKLLLYFSYFVIKFYHLQTTIPFHVVRPQIQRHPHPEFEVREVRSLHLN